MNYSFFLLFTELSKDGALASRFHKRDPSLVRQERYVPGRLRESARGEGAQVNYFVLCKDKSLGQNSQKFLRQIRKIFVTLQFKILGLLGLKVAFKTDIIKC